MNSVNAKNTSKFQALANIGGPDVRAMAVAYLNLGYSLDATRQALQEKEALPPHLLPSHTVLHNWRQAIIPEMMEATEHDETSLTRRALRFCHVIMDRMEAGTAPISPVAAVTIYGILADKALKRQDMRRRNQGDDDFLRQLREAVQRKLVAQNPPPTPTVDGEARLAEP